MAVAGCKTDQLNPKRVCAYFTFISRLANVRINALFSQILNRYSFSVSGLAVIIFFGVIRLALFPDLNFSILITIE